MAKIIYHLDEDGNWRKPSKVKSFRDSIKKFDKDRKRKITQFVRNAKKNGTPMAGKLEYQAI